MKGKHRPTCRAVVAAVCLDFGSSGETQQDGKLGAVSAPLRRTETIPKIV